MSVRAGRDRSSYQEISDRIIAELEVGRSEKTAFEKKAVQ
jgi:antirestriction protein ArdC